MDDTLNALQSVRYANEQKKCLCLLGVTLNSGLILGGEDYVKISMA